MAKTIYLTDAKPPPPLAPNYTMRLSTESGDGELLLSKVGSNNYYRLLSFWLLLVLAAIALAYFIVSAAPSKLTFLLGFVLVVACGLISYYQLRQAVGPWYQKRLVRFAPEGITVHPRTVPGHHGEWPTEQLQTVRFIEKWGAFRLHVNEGEAITTIDYRPVGYQVSLGDNLPQVVAACMGRPAVTVGAPVRGRLLHTLWFGGAPPSNELRYFAVVESEAGGRVLQNAGANEDDRYLLYIDEAARTLRRKLPESYGSIYRDYPARSYRVAGITYGSTRNNGPMAVYGELQIQDQGAWETLVTCRVRRPHDIELTEHLIAEDLQRLALLFQGGQQ